MGGGGSSGSNTNVYEKDRVAVARRNYGELASNGFQTQEQYDAAVASKTGLNYDKNYNRYSLASGVDYDSAVTDWNNYRMERAEIDEYGAAEERRKEAPDNLTGTSGQVDYTLAIEQDANATDTNVTTKKKKQAAKDVNVNASNQSLGIAQDGA